MRKCPGYGEFKDKCENKAGCPHTPYWCKRCNAIRMDTITSQLEGILNDFKKRKEEYDNQNRKPG